MSKLCGMFNNQQLKKCRESNRYYEQENERLRKKLSTYEKEQKELAQIVDLMENGPGTPKKPLRVLERKLVKEKLEHDFGGIYRQCPAKLFSDNDFLVAHPGDVQFYLDYYSMFWLPKIRPYKVIERTKLDGTKVKIWARDCDNFSDFHMGINVLHLPWTGLPWGQIWGDVEGRITGYHAFNFIFSAQPSFDEKSIEGLETYLIEPQGKNSYWMPASGGNVKVTEVERLVAQPAEGYTVNSMNMIKV